MKNSGIFERFTRSASGTPRRVRFKDHHERSDEKKPVEAKQDRNYLQSYINKTYLGTRPLAATLVIAATFLFILLIRPYSAEPVHDHQVSNRPKPEYLQLIIPVNRKSDIDLCKTILSAQVLNYPVPIIVPWGNSTDNTPVAKKQRIPHKAKQIYAHLNSLPPETDDAIAILLDGPDTWFQLRPDVLLQSYYRLTGQRNQRLRKTHGKGIDQKVIFSAYGVCGMTDENDPSCSVIPRAPSHDLPRYLGHGAIIGKAKDIRRVVGRALDILETAQEAPSRLLPIYTEIFGDQEARREQLRLLQPHQNRGKKPRYDTLKSQGSFNSTDETFELGIGLDYYNELGLSISKDTVPHWQTPQKQLHDLEASMPPYWTVSGREPNLPHSKTWSEVQLLTAHNDSIPAMIHHYPTIAMGGRDATGHRVEWWPKMWYTPYARALYTASERLPSTIVAQVRDNHGQELVFWNLLPHHNRAGAWMPGGKFLHWQDMCGLEQQWVEVFRDTNGPWKRTEWF